MEAVLAVRLSPSLGSQGGRRPLRLVAVGDSRGRVHVWAAETGVPVLQIVDEGEVKQSLLTVALLTTRGAARWVDHLVWGSSPPPRRGKAGGKNGNSKQLLFLGAAAGRASALIAFEPSLSPPVAEREGGTGAAAAGGEVGSTTAKDDTVNGGQIPEGGDRCGVKAAWVAVF